MFWEIAENQRLWSASWCRVLSQTRSSRSLVHRHWQLAAFERAAARQPPNLRESGLHPQHKPCEEQLVSFQIFYYHVATHLTTSEFVSPIRQMSAQQSGNDPEHVVTYEYVGQGTVTPNENLVKSLPSDGPDVVCVGETLLRHRQRW